MFGGIRRYLARHHPYRRNTRFNGNRETRTRPATVSGLDVIKYAAWRQSYLDLGGTKGAKSDPVHMHGREATERFFRTSVLAGTVLIPCSLIVGSTVAQNCDHIKQTLETFHMYSWMSPLRHRMFHAGV